MQRKRDRGLRLGVVGLVVVLLGACGGTSQSMPVPASGGALPSSMAAPASGDGLPTPTPARPTASSTLALPSATIVPLPTAVLTTSDTEALITQRFIKVWTNAKSYVISEVVVEVTNSTSQPLRIGGLPSYFRSYADDGSQVLGGELSLAFPNVLAPGGKGYLISYGHLPSLPAKASPRVVVELVPNAETSADALMDVGTVSLARDDLYGGLVASAKVTNTTGRDSGQPMAAFILLDGSGKILGSVFNFMVAEIAAGQTTTVTASLPGTPAMSVSAVKKTVAIVFQSGS